MGKLTGRYAIVTGAAKGIGCAIAERFLEDDVAGVALFDMDAELVAATAKELDPTGESVPAKRVGQPSEIASVASFLACDDSSWVTGNCILACGGMKMRG